MDQLSKLAAQESMPSAGGSLLSRVSTLERFENEEKRLRARLERVQKGLKILRANAELEELLNILEDHSY